MISGQQKLPLINVLMFSSIWHYHRAIRSENLAKSVQILWNSQHSIDNSSLQQSSTENATSVVASSPKRRVVVERGQWCGIVGKTEFVCNPDPKKRLLCRNRACEYVAPPPRPICTLPWSTIRKVSISYHLTRLRLKTYAKKVLGFAGEDGMATAQALFDSFLNCGSITIAGVKGRRGDALIDVVIYNIAIDETYWKINMRTSDSNGDVCFEAEVLWYLDGRHYPGEDTLIARGVLSSDIASASPYRSTPKLHIADRHAVSTDSVCPITGVTMGFVNLALGRLVGLKYADNDDAAKEPECIGETMFPHYAPMMLLATGHTFWSKPATAFNVNASLVEADMILIRSMFLDRAPAFATYYFLRRHVCSDDGYADDALRSTSACDWARNHKVDDAITWADIAKVFVHGFSTAGKQLIKDHHKMPEFCQALGEANELIPLDFCLTTLGLHCYHEMKGTSEYGIECEDTSI